MKLSYFFCVVILFSLSLQNTPCIHSDEPDSKGRGGVCFFQSEDNPYNHEGIRTFSGLFHFMFVKRISNTTNGFHLFWQKSKSKESFQYREFQRIIKVAFIVPLVHSP